MDFVGDIVRCRTSVRRVEFDAEVALGTARIVTGGENDAALRFHLPNDAGHCGSAQESILAHDQFRHLNIIPIHYCILSFFHSISNQYPVGGGDFDDEINHFRSVETAIASDDQSGALFALPQSPVQDALDEVLRVVRLLEHRNLNINSCFY